MQPDLARQILLSAVLATGCLAAADPAGDDVVVLTYGLELYGQVLEDGPENVVLLVGQSRVTIEKPRVAAIRRGGASVRPGDEFPTWHHEVSAGLGLGVHLGSIKGHGTFTDRTVPSTVPLETDYGTGLADALPGADLRWLLVRDGQGLQPLCGLETSLTFPSGEGLQIRHAQVEAVAGLRWPLGSGWSAEVLGGAGWGQAATVRSFELQVPAGGVEQVDAEADLAGPSLSAEVGVLRNLGRWQAGLSLGATWSWLSGSSTWASPSGLYAGSEDLEASLTGLDLVGRIGYRW